MMRLIIGLFFTINFCLCLETNAQSKTEFYYISISQKSYTSDEVLELYKKKKLTPTSNSLNLGLNDNNVWLVINPVDIIDNKYLIFENAHLDLIEAYFYSNGKLITTKKSGDRIDFSNRDVKQNFPNLKIPASTTLILLNVKTEGAMLVPVKILSLEDYFEYGYTSGIFNWLYFGCIFLILISSTIVLIWTKESIYFYYILSVISIGMISAVDAEYSFQYLWPDHPVLNAYNVVFYSLLIFSFVFSEKLFKIKTELPKLYTLYKITYVCYALTVLSLFFTSYNTGLKIHFFASMIVKLMSLGTAVYFLIYFKNTTSKFFLFGWTSYALSAIFYNVYVSGNLPYSFFMNNLLQIGSGIQIILFNTAILSNINILKIKADAKEAVEQNEITLNSIFDGMLQSVWMVNPDYQIIKWNSKFLDNVKTVLNIDVTNEDFKRKTVDIFGQEVMDFWTPLYERVFKGEDISFEQTYSSGRVFEYYMYPIVINKKVISVFIISNEITAKLKIKEAALKTEVTLNSIINSINQSVWIMDKNLEVVKYNDHLAKNMKAIMNITLDPDTVREDITKSISSEGRRFWDDLYYRAFNGETINFEKKWENTDRIFEYYVYPILLNNEITNVLVLSNEITEKVKQQEELIQSEEKYRSLTESAPVAIIVYDIETSKIVEANPQALAMFKRSKEELLKMDPIDLSPHYQENGQTSREATSYYVNKAAAGETVSYEWIFKIEGGDPISAEIWLNSLGSPNLLRATISDITERVNYQKEQRELIRYQSALIERIKEHEAGLSALINSTTDYICSLDTNLNFTEFNDAFAKVVYRTYKVELTKGKNIKEFIIPQIEAQSEENFEIALSGKSARCILEVPDANENSVFVDVAYSPIFSENKVIGITIIARDITENKRAEKELIEINNQIVEYKLVALRSVMNPHFLFNSLNSIQYFVAKNERKLALDYLSLFSSLIRKILNSAVNNTIPLNTELEILKNYIILEKLRFEGKFDYAIDIDPEVELDGIQIPSLLIQPYVENAILHGLTNKEEGLGFLKIKLYVEGEYLIFEVEDNGVGREKAYEIKRSRPIKEKSYGMLLTQERLDILNKTATVAVKIEDLTNELGEAAGTKVIVSIKI